MPKQNNNNTKRLTTNNSLRSTNSTRKRRGALTPKNASQIRIAFQRPPRHPVRAKPKPVSRPRVTYANSNNIGNMTANNIDKILQSMG